MPWKMNGENPEMKDGHPVWVHPDGKEIPFDAEHSLSKVASLSRESASRKDDLRKAQEQLKVLDGIENPSEFLEEAKKALETVKNLKDKDLVEAGEVEKVKAEVAKAMQEKIDAVEKALGESSAALSTEMIGGRFARSKFIGEKLAIPADLMEARFGANFKIEEGKVVAYDQSGNKVFSREKPGDPAGFDEALSILVDAYPQKDSILKGSDASGGGAPAGGGGSGGKGAKTLSRAEFEKLDPAARLKFTTEDGGTVTE